MAKCFWNRVETDPMLTPGRVAIHNWSITTVDLAVAAILLVNVFLDLFGDK